MTNVEQVRQRTPDVVELYEKMSKKYLLEACCGEILDLWAMNERVATFMEECTDMSKTTYTPEVLKKLIREDQKQRIVFFCENLLEDYEDDTEELLKCIKATAGEL